MGVFDVNGAPTVGLQNFYEEPTFVPSDAHNVAVGLARTASFFSNDQAPLSARTVRYISGIHFPPGVDNAPNAALYGIENTNRGCEGKNIQATQLAPGMGIATGALIDGTIPGLGVVTGKGLIDDSDPFAVNPGGVPIFKNNHVVGGVGVVADSVALGKRLAFQVAEFAAFVGADLPTLAAGDALTPVPVPIPAPGAVVIDGVTLPFVNQQTLPAGISAASALPAGSAYFTGFKCPDGSTTDMANPTCVGVLPMDDAYLLPAQAGSKGGLTQAQVEQLVNQSIATANITRALIRLPLESRAKMSIAVSDLDGTLLAVYHMRDGTIFSLDVAMSKARNAVYFSSTAPTVQTDLPGVPSGTAVTNRTISFGAQPFFPPGINASNPGPFYNLYKNDVANACTQGSQAPSPPPPSPNNQSGIVFFPGSLPLYINGTLVGGLGVSGDGVDQDDFVTYGGAAGFYAPTQIQADQVVIDDVRLPYLKFPRDPTD